MAPLWKFYFDAVLYNLGFTVVYFFAFQDFMGTLLIFCSVGPLVSIMGYRQFKKEQYVFYHNLGYSKNRLHRFLWTVSIMAVLPLFLLILAL
ncbi:MAG: hypothetical protein CFE23_04620 [Flavobacterium sp. BFFFF1]|uniref:hypothetical protein n=1 Tax=Flavobacterium sp. BFFFF1 TaxID=2015557 RepID=UPI000BD6F331|nr:hypothetical protein [Flavobacterium sp. BFFFF1]OYU81379.1 MAG: hypothetical protein CFE23_04620 [Flavobacterium sp. BFFFF1]